ncbi:MAG: DNA cytosine methyltransferase [Candidatus Helarchaeota archaeon]|nr:DNA cytosine methyltransferase [Candidatus Helarchaeota archaeon]
MNQKIIALDLFAGCGGLSKGFENAGIYVAVANEVWEPAIESYQHNHPDTTMIRGDVTDSKVKEKIIRAAKKEGVNLVIGGPPCQAFSTSGYRNCLDERFYLVKEYIKIVKEIKPSVFVMENVKGILSSKTIRSDISSGELNEVHNTINEIFRYKQLKRYKAQRYLTEDESEEWNRVSNDYKINLKKMKIYEEPISDKIVKQFKKMGYHIFCEVLNAVNFEIAQHRERVFFIGFKNPPDSAVFPKGSSKIIPCRTVLKDLENKKENEVPNHVFTRHKPSFVERLKKVVPGKSLTKYREGFFRLEPDKPSPTVKENHGSVFIHYSKHRCVTPRELARLQSYTDKFIFKGTKSAVLKQIGNSVPPKLANTIASHLKQFFN